MFAHGIKCTCGVPLPMYLGIWDIIGTKIERNDISSFQGTPPLIFQGKNGNFCTDLVDSMLNTLCTLELANGSQLFTATWKYYHAQWRANIIQ